MALGLDPQPQSSTPSPQENPWLELAKTFVTAGILAFGIRTFVAEARYIPSSSMEPTLQINDRLIIEKVSYRFQEPQRGDIVVFNAPTTAAICSGSLSAPAPKDAFIKRIVGLPGDTVEFKDAQVFINGKKFVEPYIVQDGNTLVSSQTLVPINSVFVANASSSIDPLETPLKLTIPTSSYLVMGDNRNNSCDSRYWGFVPKKDLIGKALVKFWPFTRVGPIDGESPEQIKN